MRFEVVSCFIILTEIISVYGRQKFVIENKKTGKVIEDVGSGHEVLEWDNTDLQLWTLEPKGNTYKIRNVASEKFIKCEIHNSSHTKWKLNIQGDTRIAIDDPRIILCDEDATLICCGSKSNDESDVWTFIEQPKKIGMTFAIENKKTGEVLVESHIALEMERWKNRNSQLWTLKPHAKSGYSIVNVASGRVLAYYKNDITQEIWKFNTRGDTWIYDEDSNVFLVLKNGKPVFSTYIQNDDSEKWLFIERESRKQIYVEDYEERFVIENKKTGMVMDIIEENYMIMEWSNKNSQLWTLKSKHNSGYFITNVATQYHITCKKNGTNYSVWKLNVENETRIEIEDPTITLNPSMEDNNIYCSSSKPQNDSDIWILIEQSKKNNMKFMIENKKTGKMLEAVDGSLVIGNWQNRDYQLWTLKLQNESGYFIVNVADGRVLTYSKYGINNKVLKFNPHKDTRIQIAHLNVFLANKNGKPIFLEDKQNDDSDKWRFVQQESAENSMQQKQIYVDDYQDKLVIENKKTKKVLGILEGYLVLEEWKDKDLQLWTLEPQNKSGSVIIRNVEDRGILTHNNNGTDYQTWKINTQGETWIQLEDVNVFLADKDGAVTFVENKQGDESDLWLLVDQTSKTANRKSKPIYIEAHNKIL